MRPLTVLSPLPRRISPTVKIGITGLPGSGKTQTLLRIIELLEEEGVKVGGMVTEPIVEKQRRTGFKITNWLSKEHEVFAHEGMKSRIRSGRYGVNLAALEDVGKMEVESELFTKAVVETLDAKKSIVMTLHKKSRNPLLQDIRRRDELRLLEVTPINKNLLAFKIVHLITGRSH
jgi:nucleoside-triphosphatase